MVLWRSSKCRDSDSSFPSWPPKDEKTGKAFSYVNAPVGGGCSKWELTKIG
jgi:hypothetical protein